MKLIYSIAAFILCLTMVQTTVQAKEYAPWRVSDGKDIVKLFDMPPKDGTVFLTTQVYYDVKTRSFLLDVSKIPQSVTRLTKQNKADYLLHVITPDAGRSYWLSAQQAPSAFTNIVVPIDMYEADSVIFAGSRMLRTNGGESYDQPFGSLRVKTFIEEDRSGKGQIGLKVVNKAGDILFTLTEDYIGDSRDYHAYWSPDGRYVYINLPGYSTTAKPGELSVMNSDHFMVAGPFDTKQPMQVITERVRTQKAKHDKLPVQIPVNMEELNQRYGHLFDSVKTKIMECENIKRKIGRITDLSLDHPNNVMGFGETNVIGLHFILSFENSAGESGKLQSSVLFPQNHQQYQDKYKKQLETVALQIDYGSYYVECP